MEHRIVVTTEPATSSSPGAVAYGSFAVEGEKIRVRNDRGKLVGTAELVPGDDPAHVARKILRGSSASSHFHRPISYPPLSLV